MNVPTASFDSLDSLPVAFGRLPGFHGSFGFPAVLASSGDASHRAAAGSSWISLHLPAHWPGQMDLVGWCQSIGPAEAAIMILAGIVYLLWGLEIFKILVMLNSAVVGTMFGGIIGEKIGAGGAGAMVGAFIAAIVTWPLMKYAVSVMGTAFGAVAGACLWRAFDLPPDLSWAGGMSGMIFFGMMSFVLFRGSIIMYLSLQGAAMLMLGILALAAKYQGLVPQLGKVMVGQPLFLPTAIFIPAVIGLVFQQSGAKPKPGAAPMGKPPEKK